MFAVILLYIKIRVLSNRVYDMNIQILRKRRDAELVNNLYYCGRGNPYFHIEDWCDYMYFRIAACQRLIYRYQKRLESVKNF